jgi:hypothetical protein
MTKPKEAQLDLLLRISEGLSKRSYEMLQVSPTDAIHAPSCGLAIRDAVDELRWMRAEIEKLRAAIQSLAERLEVDPSGTDKIDDLEAEVERLREVIRTIRARCVELDDSDAVSETLDIATAVLEAKP